MLRKLLDKQLKLFGKDQPLAKLRPLGTAADSFFYEPLINTRSAPHIRDAVDLKRWMILVVVALLPCILFAIWNSGLQKVVYSSGNYHLMNEYLSASTSLSNYFDFALKDGRYLTFLKEGLMAFLPVMIISYVVGGIWEGIFACLRGHEIAEGFLVTGMLYPLVLPPTIPYWMVAVGVSAGVVIGKEVFGGTGMNIFNPALISRCFLFFTFPGKMTGSIWAGTNPTIVADSLAKMNQDAIANGAVDGYSQATPLAIFNATSDIKRIHVDAIAAGKLGNQGVDTLDLIQKQFSAWKASLSTDSLLPESLHQLSSIQLQQFVTSPIDQGGLGLAIDNYQAACDLTNLHYGIGQFSDGNFFLGNKLGCFGETSVLACLLGAIFILYMGVGAWRTMVAMALGAYVTATLFDLGSHFFGPDSGAWNPAKFAFPAYKHLLLGGFAFGLVFMATDPVSSPMLKSAKWVYGILIGFITLIIRTINPGYPEGVMLAILFGNVFAPLIETYMLKFERKRALKKKQRRALELA